MTSQLNVDTIVDKAGSGGSNVKMANTSIMCQRVNAKTLTMLCRGCVKIWSRFKVLVLRVLTDLIKQV